MATFGQFVQLGPINENVGGAWKLYHYAAGTSTLKDVWTDRAKTTTAAQPVLADSRGIMSFYADGLYRFQVYDSNDQLLYTWDNVFYGSLESANHAEGSSLTSSSTLVLGADGDYFHVTGTNTISAIQGSQPFVFLTFDSALTVTHNASTLVLKGGTNHVTVPGETLLFINDGDNVFREVDNNVPTKNGDQTFTGTNTFNGTTSFGSSVTFSSTATIGDPIQPTHLANKRYTDRVAASTGWANFGFLASVASNALTVSLINQDGLTPSTDNSPVVSVPYTASGGSGSDNLRTVTGATTITLSAGSTLGFTANQISRIYVVAIDNSGSVEVGLYHPLSGANIVALNESKAYNTTAEGGAGAADSAQVIYTTTARTNVSIRVVGWIEIQTGATAGNWSNAPISSKLLGSGMPRTGDVVQRIFTSSTAVAGGNTAVPFDDTIPQNTEGAEVMTLAITPQSAANLLMVTHVGNYSSNTNLNFTVALFQDSTANALAVTTAHAPSVDYMNTVPLIYWKQAGTTSSTTFKVRAGASDGAAVIVNGRASTSGRLYGGVSFSGMTITEVFV